MYNHYKESRQMSLYQHLYRLANLNMRTLELGLQNTFT